MSLNKQIKRINDWKNSMCSVTYADNTHAIVPSHMVPELIRRAYWIQKKEDTRRTTN